jgi:creatinine amidohydrolase
MHYGDLRWIDVDAADRENLVVVCPLGSLEQHGHHLPLLTDTYLVTAVADRVHERLADRICLLPALWLGASDHHLDFPGTVSASNTLYTAIIKDVLRSLVRGGWRRIFFLNGHGGNVAPGETAITAAANACDRCDAALIALSSYWTIAAPAMNPAAHGMHSPTLTHACEYETSMMLHVRGQVVKMDAPRRTVPSKDRDRRPGPARAGDRRQGTVAPGSDRRRGRRDDRRFFAVAAAHHPKTGPAGRCDSLAASSSRRSQRRRGLEVPAVQGCRGLERS